MRVEADKEQTASRATGQHRPGPAADAGGPGASWLVLPPRRVWRWGLVLVLGQAVLRMMLGLGAYFTQDDFVFYSKGALEPFSWAFLFQDRGDHLMPAVQAVTWVLARVAPLDHPTAIAVSALLQLLASLAVLGALREAFGLRTGILAPLSFYLFSTLTLPAFLWWAASLNALGMQLGMALAVWCHLRWIRTRRVGWIAGTAVSTALGLLFFEKAVLILPFLVGVTWVVERSAGPVRDLGRTLLRHLLAWVPLTLIVVGWAVLYKRQVNTEYAVPSTWSTGSDLVVDATSHGILPAIFGGPWSWTTTSVFLGYAPNPPSGWVLASWAGLLALAGLTLLLRRGMARMMIITVGYLAADLALLVWGRSGAVGPGVGMEFRYYADAALVIALLIGYGFMPLRDERDPWRPESEKALAWVRAHADLVRGAAWLCLIGWLVGAMWSTLGLGVAWRASLARPYIETAKAQLATLPRDAVMLSQPVPGFVALGWFVPYNGTAYVFAPLHNRPKFGDQTDQLRVINDDGTIHDATVTGVRSPVGPNPGCGWPVSGQPLWIPLEVPTYPWDWTVKIAYLAGADTDVVVRLGDGSATVHLSKGLHDVYFPLVGGGSGVLAEVKSPGVGVCIDRVDVGNRTPGPTTAPTGQVTP